MVERIDTNPASDPTPDPQTDPLSRTLKAAGDPTRRAILTHLAQEGPARVTDIAARFDISLNAVSKHIMVLEKAGLVTRRTKWREHLIEVNLAPLTQVFRWFQDLRSVWDLRLDDLEAHLAKEMTDD